MAHLNFSYEDLASVICIAHRLASLDGEVSDSEAEAIIKSITDQYNFNGKDDLLKSYLNDGMEMDVEDALKHISAFDANGKQWASNFFAKTIIADGNLTEKEKSLYWKIMDICKLPDNDLTTESESGSEAESTNTSLSNKVYPVVHFKKITEEILDGEFTFLEFSENNRNNIFRFFGDPDSLQFYRDTPKLNQLRELVSYSAPYKIILIFAKPEDLAHPVKNEVASILVGETVYGPLVFAVEDDKKNLYGISYSNDLKKLVNAVKSVCGDSFLVAGENNPSLTNRYHVAAFTAIDNLK